MFAKCTDGPSLTRGYCKKQENKPTIIQGKMGSCSWTAHWFENPMIKHSDIYLPALNIYPNLYLHANSQQIKNKLFKSQANQITVLKGTKGGRFMILNFINLSRLKDWKNILPLSPLAAPTFILDLNLDYSSSKKHQRIYLNIFYTVDRALC